MIIPGVFAGVLLIFNGLAWGIWALVVFIRKKELRNGMKRSTAYGTEKSV